MAGSATASNPTCNLQNLLMVIAMGDVIRKSQHFLVKQGRGLMNMLFLSHSFTLYSRLNAIRIDNCIQ